MVAACRRLVGSCAGRRLAFGGWLVSEGMGTLCGIEAEESWPQTSAPESECISSYRLAFECVDGGLALRARIDVCRLVV